MIANYFHLIELLSRFQSISGKQKESSTKKGEKFAREKLLRKMGMRLESESEN